VAVLVVRILLPVEEPQEAVLQWTPCSQRHARHSAVEPAVQSCQLTCGERLNTKIMDEGRPLLRELLPFLSRAGVVGVNAPLRAQRRMRLMHLIHLARQHHGTAFQLIRILLVQELERQLVHFAELHRVRSRHLHAVRKSDRMAHKAHFLEHAMHVARRAPDDANLPMMPISELALSSGSTPVSRQAFQTLPLWLCRG
jgi:hypothetical protein